MEEATQTKAPEHEKIGQLTVVVEGYPPFEMIMDNLELISQYTSTQVKYVDVNKNLVRWTEFLKINSDRRVNSQRSQRPRKKTDSDDSSVSTTKHNNYLAKEEYDKLLAVQKSSLWKC